MRLAGSSPQDLPLLARRDLDRAGQSSLVRGRHLHPDGQGLPLPGGDHGLGEPCRAGVAFVEYARCRVLCRGPGRSALPVRPPRNLQHRPGQPIHQRRLHRHPAAPRGSSSGCGAASNTRRSTSTPMPASPRPRPASALGSAFTTRSASTRAWAIVRHAKSMKQNARGYVDDRRCRPAAPSPTSPPAQPPTTGLRLTQKRCHDRRARRDRSRYGNRPGYTLEDGSGCLTIGVHPNLYNIASISI